MSRKYSANDLEKRWVFGRCGMWTDSADVTSFNTCDDLNPNANASCVCV